ncbi:MAG: DUF302 domain-containing protein, partial [Desulfosarcina sp.]|nr:DUF302 domain-containing protein [Desulfobacterales bacterium]
MKNILLLAAIVWFMAVPAYADSGLVNVQSTHTVAQTADRLETLLKEKGLRIFIRINHAAGAQKAGITLRPTELLIFGSPKVGAPLMARQQSIGIDLPQKMLIWEDAAGQVWLTYNNPDYLAARH